MSTPPDFPPPFITGRVRSLGYGTGPWSREALVERWGEPTADKFVAEAKASGWLVSPSRGVYFVPPVQDIMTVSWLPDPIRSEFLVSRTLASAQIPNWCLSAWCRDHGLELGAPVFVTDVGVGAKAAGVGDVADPGSGGVLDRRALRASAMDVAKGRRGGLPFEDALVVVPSLPRLDDEPEVRWALAPEGEEAPRRPDGLERRARGFPYSLGPAVRDDAWIVALLAALGTPRLEELVGGMRQRGELPEAAAIQRWAGLIGPPQPVAGWQDALRDGPFPYLLVPPALWMEMGADQAARRFRMLERLAEG